MPGWGAPVLELMSCSASLEEVAGPPLRVGSTLAISAVTLAVSDSASGTCWVMSVDEMTLSGSGTEGVANEGCGDCNAWSTALGSRLNWAGFCGGVATGWLAMGSSVCALSASGLISMLLTVKGPVGAVWLKGTSMPGIL